MEEKKTADLTDKELLQEYELSNQKIDAEYKILKVLKGRREEQLSEIIKRFGGQVNGL